LLFRSPLDAAALREAVKSLQQQSIGVAIDETSPWLLHRNQYAGARAEMLTQVQAFHRDNPLKAAMFTEELRSKFPRMADKVFAALLRDLTAAGDLEVSRDKVKLTTHAVTLSPARQALLEALEDRFRQAAFQPPSAEEALSTQEANTAEVHELLQVLVDQQKLVRLKGEIFYHCDALAEIERQLRTHLEAHQEITAGAFRDLLQISRKYAIPLLEYFDNQRLTIRIGDKRVLRKAG
jgi:selenocysteine-specific elongation factor